jgi:ArsR family transcriptional regulator
VATKGKKTAAGPDFNVLADRFKMLADPMRLEILHLVNQRKRVTTTEVVEAMGDRLAQPTITHHLILLYRGGFLDREKVGVFAYYSPVAAQQADVIDRLTDLFPSA